MFKKKFLAFTILSVAMPAMVLAQDTSSGSYGQYGQYGSPSAGVWMSKAPMPAARTQMAVVSLGGIIYLAGGGTQTDFSTQLFAYNVETDSWTARNSMSTARTVATAQAIDGLLYVVSGYLQGSYPTSLEVYDPSSDSWSTRQSLPTGRAGAASGVVNGKLYVIGGDQGGNPLPAVEVYNPAFDSWETKKSMPTARTGAASAVVNGKIYVIGGAKPNEQLAIVEAYDPATDSWEMKKPMPFPRTYIATSAVAINGKIYVVGGWAGKEPQASVVVYDTVSDSWSYERSLSAPRYHHAVAATQEMLFVFGGYNAAGAPVDTVEAMTPSLRPLDQITPPADSTSGLDSGIPALESGTVGSPSTNGLGKEVQKRFEQEQAQYQKRFEKERKKQEELQLKKIKRGLDSFGRALTQFKKIIANLERQRIAVPADFSSAFATADHLLKKVRAAKSLEEISAVQDEFMEASQVLQEWGERLPLLTQVPRAITQADQQLKKIRATLAKDRVRAAKARFDVSELLGALEVKINKLAAAFDEAKSLAGSDPEAAMEKLQSEFFEALNDAWDNDETIQLILGFSSGVVQRERQLKNNTTIIKRLTRQKKDTAALNNLLLQMKEKLTAVQALIKIKSFNAEDFVTGMEEIGEFQHQFDEKVEELTGVREFAPKLEKGQKIEVTLPNL